MMWEPFRAQDLSWLSSEERICLVSEHRCTSPSTEKALRLFPTKKVERDCQIFTVSNATPWHLRGVPMQPTNSHLVSGPSVSR